MIHRMLQSYLVIVWLTIPDAVLSDEALLEGSKPIESIRDENFLESLTSEILSQKSDAEIAPIYVTRICGGWYNSKWAEYVDDDIMRREGSTRILLHLLRYPNTRSVPGSLWQWLSKHPNHPATNQIIDESLKTVRSGEVFWESRLVDKSARRKAIRFGNLVMDLFSVRQLAYLMATVMDPRCEEVFEEFDKIGVALDVAKSRYASQLKRQQSSMLTNSSPSLQPQTQKKADQAKPASSGSEEPTSSAPWSVIVILIVATSGLLWLLLKKRK